MRGMGRGLIQTAILALGLLAASACQRGTPDTAAEPDTVPAPSAQPASPQAASEPASIFRPGIEPEVAAMPERPLEAAVSFAEGGTSLSDQAHEQLQQIMASPQMEQGGAIILRGNTDAAGTDEANLRVSGRRAEAVRKYLIDRGVAARRISIIALGERRPVRPNAKLDGSDDEAGQAANRRVDVTVELP